MSLLVWLPLNGSLENKGLSDLKFINLDSSISSASNGKVTPNCMTRGSDRYNGGIISTTKLDITSTLSMFAWIKPNGLNIEPMGIGGMHSIYSPGWGPGTGMGFQVVDISGTYRLGVSTGTGSGRTWQDFYSTTHIVMQQWQHVGFTFNGTQLKIYINGIEDSVHNITNQSNIADYVSVFGWAMNGDSDTYDFYNDYKFYGSINDFRIYDHCLSPREVKLLSQGLVAHYKLADPSIEPTVNLLNGVWSHTNFWSAPLGTYTSLTPQLNNGPCEVVNFNNIQCLRFLKRAGTQTGRVYSTYPLTANKTYTVSLDYYATTTHNSALHTELDGGGYKWTPSDCAYTTPNQWRRLSITLTPTSNTTLYIFAYTNLNEYAYINNIQLEEKGHATPYTPSSRDGQIAHDCSGYGNHGTASAALETSIDSPRYSHSTILNNNKYINCSRASDSTNGTLSAWVKVDSYPTSNAVVIADHSSKIAFGFWGGTNAIISCGTEANTTRTVTNIASKWITNKWNHIVVTKQNNTYTFYLNGMEWSTYGTNNYWTHSASNKLYIGGRNNGSFDTPFTGKISDVRVYTTALPAAAVKEIYESSISFLDNGTLQCSEIVENNTNLKYNQNGSVQTNNFDELENKKYPLSLMRKKSLPDGSLWARIHYLDVNLDNYNSKSYFDQNANETAECINKSNRFSLMKCVDDMKINDKYEFMLTYDTPIVVPYEYTQLEYVQSNGEQYIDTGIGYNSTQKIELDLKVKYNRVDVSNQIMGFTGHAGCGIGLSPQANFWLDGQATVTSNTSTIHNLEWYVNGTNWSRTINHTAYTSTNANTNTTNNLFLFACARIAAEPTNIQYKCYCNLYSARIKINEEVVREFIPCCRNSDGVVGMYDIINKQFYISNSGIMLKAGPIVSGGLLYNRWSQTSSPNASAVEGYNPIGAQAWTGANAGLRKIASAQCVYTCDVPGTWYAPIGQHGYWTTNKYIPMADKANSATSTELWIRIPKLTKLSMFNKALQAHQIYEL